MVLLGCFLLGCIVRCLVWFSWIVERCEYFYFGVFVYYKGFIVLVVGFLDFSCDGCCGRKIFVFWFGFFFCFGVFC